MSTISSGTTLTTALVQTGDTTGDLVIKTGASNTTAVTINTAGAIGVGSSPSYGSAGQYLQSAGNAAPATWATVPAATPGGSTTQVQYNNAGAFGGSANFVWDNTNVRLGVGTASPLTRLEVNGNASLTGAQPTFVGNIRITDNPTAVNAAGGLEFFTSNFASGYGWKMASIDSSGVQLTFSTRQNSATWSEQMRIASTGNVGIGTTSTSAARLTVRGAGTTSSTASLELATSGGATRLYVRDDGATSFYGSSNVETMRIDASGNLLFNSGYGSAATAYGCRAWVNFNPSSGGAVRASGGVSSLTDNGSANYTINLSFTMPDTNYAAAGMVRNNDNNNDTCVVQMQSSGTKSTTAFQVKTIENGGGFTASPEANVMIFR